VRSGQLRCVIRVLQHVCALEGASITKCSITYGCRFVVRGEHAAYLEDDEGEEDFFGAGAALARPGLGGGGKVREATGLLRLKLLYLCVHSTSLTFLQLGTLADIEADRQRRRDAAAAQSGGWLSWLKW
jgi:hypothetical protein